MKPEWKQSVGNQGEICRAAWMANHAKYDNAIKINKHQHYNGSGEKSFGGAKKWPVLSVEISFEVGQEDLMNDMANRIQAIIDEMLP